MIDIIAGTFFICDAPITSETFQSLSDEQIKKYDKMFRDPERFYRVGDEIKVQKIKSSRGMERSVSGCYYWKHGLIEQGFKRAGEMRSSMYYTRLLGETPNTHWKS